MSSPPRAKQLKLTPDLEITTDEGLSLLREIEKVEKLKKKVNSCKQSILRQKQHSKQVYADYFKNKRILLNYIDDFKDNKVFYDLLKHYKIVDEEDLFYKKKEVEVIDLE